MIALITFGILVFLGFAVWCFTVEKRLRLMGEIAKLLDEKIEARP